MKKEFNLSEKIVELAGGKAIDPNDVKEFIKKLKDKRESMKIRLTDKAFESRLTNGDVKTIFLYKDVINEIDDLEREIDKLAGEDLI